MGARRKARELALQMLFQFDMSGNQPDQIIDTFEELQKSKPNTRDFATKIFRGTVEHVSSIDTMIQDQAENWRLSRMAAVDRNIIRMSVYEFLHEDDTPKLVIIDETIVMFGMEDPVAGSNDLTIVVVEHSSLARVLKTAFDAIWASGLTFAQAYDKLVTRSVQTA